MNLPKKGSKILILADDDFAVRTDMMKPFRELDINSQKREIYNYRVSRAKRIVENALEILPFRFRIYETQINIGSKTIDTVVMESFILHIFFM